MIEMSGICRLKIGLHRLHLQSRVCSPAISGVEISVRISHYKSSSHEEKPPGTSGTFMAQKDILCRKSASRFQNSPLTTLTVLPMTFCCSDGDVRFELSDDSKSSLFLPSSAASPNSVPIRIPFNDLLSLSADRHYVIFSCTSRSYRIRLRFQDAARLLPKDRFLLCNRGILLNIQHIREVRGNDFVMSDGSVFPLSRRKKKELMHTLQLFPVSHNIKIS